ncbi:MAG: hypothetical protein WBN34_03120 [Woeseia sp.]
MKIVRLLALAATVGVLGGCAGALSDVESFAREDAYVQMVESYTSRVQRCRERRGAMISAGSFRRNISGRLSAEQMISARCASGR